MPNKLGESLLIECKSNESIWGWYKKDINGNLFNIKSNVHKVIYLKASGLSIEYFKYKIGYYPLTDAIYKYGSNLTINYFQSDDFSTYVCIDSSYKYVESQFVRFSKYV